MKLDGLKEHSLSHKMQLLSRLQEKVDLFTCEESEEPERPESPCFGRTITKAVTKHLPAPKKMIPNYLKYLMPMIDFDGKKDASAGSGTRETEPDEERYTVGTREARRSTQFVVSAFRDFKIASPTRKNDDGRNRIDSGQSNGS